MADPLCALLQLSDEDKAYRGLQFTPHEIAQQPTTWEMTYKLCRTRGARIVEFLKRIGIATRAAPMVYLVGAGTSDYSGRALASLLRLQWHCDVWAIPSTTLLTEFAAFHAPGRLYLWISFSRSGDSPEGVALLQRAIEDHREIRHLLITCNAQGKMAKLCSEHPDRAFALVLDDAVNDRGLAMTSSFTNMLLAGQYIGCAEHPEFERTVAELCDAGRRFLPAAAEVAATIAKLGCTRACFIGSGALRGVADECALKVVELTSGKITTLAETPLGLRHGPMSSVDGNTALVAFLSSDPGRRGYELDLIREIDRKRLGRVRVAITAKDGNDLTGLVDHCLSLNADLADEHRPILDVMFGQLLGLFASIESGLKPDQPSPTGTITRVVQPIKLY